MPKQGCTPKKSDASLVAQSLKALAKPGYKRPVNIKSQDKINQG